MYNATSPGDSDWEAILAGLPSDLDLDLLARETKAIQRARAIPDAATLLRLALMHGPGGQSLRQTSTWAYISGVADMAAPSLSDRLHRSVGFFDALTARLLAARAPARPTPWHGRCLHLCDASSLSQPGSKGTDWRIHATYDLGRAGFSRLELTDGHGAEALSRVRPKESVVVIADRGYAKAGEMAALLHPAGGPPCDFIIRTGWAMLRLETEAAEAFDLIGGLRRMQADGASDQPREWSVQALHGRGKQVQRLPLRLLVVALPADKAAEARQDLRRKASRQQRVLDPRSELAAGFMVLVTSLPPEIPGADICAVYRLRWQIELAFKRLKSLLRIDRLPTRTKEGSLSWLYSHLILALLVDDICQEILASPPEPDADVKPDVEVEPDVEVACEPSLWALQAAVIAMLCAALVPNTFTLADFVNARSRVLPRLAEPPRKRLRQRIFSAKSLS
jgi:hypothetical protein